MTLAKVSLIKAPEHSKDFFARHHKGDAGFDLKSNENIVVEKKSTKSVNTGLAVDLGDCYAKIYPRSGLASKKGIDVYGQILNNETSVNGLSVVITNYGDEDLIVKRGDAIAQLILHKDRPVDGSVFSDRHKEKSSDIKSLEDVVIKAYNRYTVSTGLHLKKEDTWKKIYSRQDLCYNHQIEVGAGVIDSGYTGEVKVVLFNHSSKDFTIHKGDVIAHLVIHEHVDIENAVYTKENEREAGGFGSTTA